MPSIKREKLYNIKDLKQITGSDPLVIIGACAGPYPFFGVDSEASILSLYRLINSVCSSPFYPLIPTYIMCVFIKIIISESFKYIFKEHFFI